MFLFCLFQIFGVIFACCLARKIKERRDFLWRNGAWHCDSACHDQCRVRICRPYGTSAGHVWVEGDDGLPKTWVQVECGVSVHDVKKWLWTQAFFFLLSVKWSTMSVADCNALSESVCVCRGWHQWFDLECCRVVACWSRLGRQYVWCYECDRRGVTAWGLWSQLGSLVSGTAGKVLPRLASM